MPNRDTSEVSETIGSAPCPREPFRVFISYSHDNSDKAEKVARALALNGLDPLYDRQFNSGQGFHEQIKNFIAHSHVFAPIITEDSSNRGWVQQEIGYAMALNIPVLPIADGRHPEQFLHGLHAVEYVDNDSELAKRLGLDIIAWLVREAQENSRALYECADLQEHRTQMMIHYATRVLRLGKTGMLRQKGALSSMHIPDKPPKHPAWRLRAQEQERSEYICRLLRDERRVLEEHVRVGGCRLIIDPSLTYKSPLARRTRIASLIEFLESIADAQIQVAIKESLPVAEHITLLGNWFLAKTVSATLGAGYRQTIFTRHAPTIHCSIEEFDQEMSELFEEQRISPPDSRRVALERLISIVADLDRQLSVSG